MKKRGHAWRFFRAGGFDQVRLDSGADLLALDQLDQKLWVALACPTNTIDVDARTLELLDSDKDKRVRANELIAAAKWAGGLLAKPDDLTRGAGELAIAGISTESPEGKALADVAHRVLATLRKDPTKDPVTVGEATDAVKTLYASALNGDGIVGEQATTSEELKAVVRDVLACIGGEADRSGEQGINQARVDQFFAEVAAYLTWHDAGKADATISPVPDAAAARAALSAVQSKIDDYFARCRLSAFDPRAAGAMNREDKDYLTLSALELSIRAQEIAAFPLARIEPHKPLPLAAGLNPAWEDAVTTLNAKVLTPLLGARDALTEGDWAKTKVAFTAYDAWQATKKGAMVESLGVDRMRALQAGMYREQITKLIADDLAVDPIAKGVADLEKLVRFHRDLHRLANNFVSFRDFYARKDKAVFQAGTLFIDQRSCDLCIRVEDASKHALMAPLARTYLAYCDCVREGKKMTIACAFTAGDSDNLMVGRNGVFYDRDGKDWDATITKIVDNPISVRQAFWAPYKKLIRFIEEQTAKRAAAEDAAANKKLLSAAEDLGTAAESGQVQPAKPKIDIGMVAALGVAVGGLTAALGAIMQAFFGLGFWMPLGFVALLFAISGPSMAVAWLKLRQRNLAPLLDANGWAMNSPARINIPFGGALTQVAVLPKGASRDLRDPYQEARTRWPAYATVACLLLAAAYWLSGHADHLLPERVQKAHLIPTLTHTRAPPPPPIAKEGGT